jgi:hypothetical protein
MPISYNRRIEGCPNFRRVPLTLSLSSSGPSTPSADAKDIDGLPTIDGKMVCGRCVGLFFTVAV